MPLILAVKKKRKTQVAPDGYICKWDVRGWGERIEVSRGLLKSLCCLVDWCRYPVLGLSAYADQCDCQVLRLNLQQDLNLCGGVISTMGLLKDTLNDRDVSYQVSICSGVWMHIYRCHRWRQHMGVMLLSVNERMLIQRRTTRFHTVLLCLYLADPATFLASNGDLDLMFLWGQLVFSVMEK